MSIFLSRAWGLTVWFVKLYTMVHAVVFKTFSCQAPFNWHRLTQTMVPLFIVSHGWNNCENKFASYWWPFEDTSLHGQPISVQLNMYHRFWSNLLDQALFLHRENNKWKYFLEWMLFILLVVAKSIQWCQLVSQQGQRTWKGCRKTGTPIPYVSFYQGADVVLKVLGGHGLF